MVQGSSTLCAKGQHLIYGVKRARVPTSLRTSVVARRKEAGATSCLDEMSRLMSCWRLNSFDDTACNKEIESFTKCATVALKKRADKTQSKMWTPQKLSQLLKDHQLPEERIKQKRIYFDMLS